MVNEHDQYIPTNNTTINDCITPVHVLPTLIILYTDLHFGCQLCHIFIGEIIIKYKSEKIYEFFKKWWLKRWLCCMAYRNTPHTCTLLMKLDKYIPLMKGIIPHTSTYILKLKPPLYFICYQYTTLCCTYVKKWINQI